MDFRLRSRVLWCVLLVALPGLAAATESWLTSSPPDVSHSQITKEISGEFYVEVPVSLFEAAAYRLDREPIIPLTTGDLQWFSRGHFSCPSGAAPNLVRAVYTNGGTGGYYLERVDSTLWVTHQSLGVSTGDHRSALLVCLDFKPIRVVVTAGGAI